MKESYLRVFTLTIQFRYGYGVCVGPREGGPYIMVQCETGRGFCTLLEQQVEEVIVNFLESQLN